MKATRLAAPLTLLFALVARNAQAQHEHHLSPSTQGVAASAAASAYALSLPVLAHPPVIDGRISADEWAAAARVSGFTQREPAAGAPMTESTEVLVARGADRLYVAFIAYDRDMKSVRAELTRRDAFSADADAVGVAIDPYGSGSHGYHFLFNPLGAQSDAAGSGFPDFTWDGVLESRGEMLADRFVVELSIPFATILTGGRPRAEWDVNFFRQIPRKGEEGWWSPVPRSEQRHLFEHMGRLTGLGDVEGRPRVELIPTATAHAHRYAAGGPQHGDASWGATVRLPFTPIVRAEVTYRPDFSAVETDEAKVGFNERFALFYPEKRPFFLEGATRFETPGSSFVSDPIRLIHTRTLVRPRLGARLLASPEGAFVGGMFVADERADGTTAGTAEILRAKIERAGGVQAGVIGTRRDTDGGSNTVGAADAQMRLPASSTLTLQFARSVTASDSLPTPRYGTAAYTDLSRETARDFEQVVFRRIDRAFETQLGYVPRSDLQQIVSHGGLYIRRDHSALLTVSPMMQYVLTLDEAGRRLEAEYLPHLELTLTRQSHVFLGYRFGEESFRDREYSQGRAELRLITAPSTWLAMSAAAKHGRRVRYDLGTDAVDQTFVADYDECAAGADIRAGRAMAVNLGGTWRRLGGNPALPARDIWLGRIETLYHMSSTTFVRGLAQYDPDDHSRQASLLLGTEVNYGTQVHLGADYSSAAATTVPTEVERASVFVRVSYLLRP